MQHFCVLFLMQRSRIRAMFMTFFIAGRKNWSKKIIIKKSIFGMSWGVTFGSVEVRFQLLLFFGSIIDPLSPSPVPISFFFPSSDLICSSSLFPPPTPAVSS